MRSSPFRAIWIVVALAAAAVMATAATAAAAPTPVEGGELDWGVKEEFREYIESTPAGQIEVAGGAAEAEDGTYRFPVVSGSYDEGSEKNEVQYAGSVEFTKYGGVLDITIANPKVVLEGDAGAIFAEVTSGSSDYGEIGLVELDATGVVPVAAGETLAWASIKSALSAEAEPAFQSYPAGTPFDDVNFTDSWVPTPPIAPTAVVGGELDWGVKESFRNYIKTNAQEGKVEVTGGAVEAEDGTYRFPVVSGTYFPETGTNEVQYGGTVHYTAYPQSYGPLLDITLKEPRLVLTGDAGGLYADAVVRSESTHELEDIGEVQIVELDATGVTPVAGHETLTWTGIDSSGATGAEEVFGSRYGPGTPFDAVTAIDSWITTPPFVEPEEEGEKEESGNDSNLPSGGGDTGSAGNTGAADVTPISTVAKSGKPGKVRVPTATRTISAGGVVGVATLSCPAGGSACRTNVPKRLGVKIDGRRYVLRVTVPKRIGAGRSATVQVHVPKAARTALGAKKILVKLKVALKANGLTTKKTVKVKIAGRH